MVENKVLENVCSFRKGIDEIIIKNSSDESLKDSIINILEDNLVKEALLEKIGRLID